MLMRISVRLLVCLSDGLGMGIRKTRWLDDLAVRPARSLRRALAASHISSFLGSESIQVRELDTTRVR